MTTAYDALFAASAKRWNVPQSILEAIAWKESSMRPNIDPNPPTDGVGLMQMTEATARRLGYTGTREGLKDPATNIELGAKYVAAIIESQGGINLADLYSEYNSGRAALWRTSTEVARNVAGFLSWFAKVVGVPLPQGVSINDAMQKLGSLQTDTFVPLLFALALILFWKR